MFDILNAVLQERLWHHQGTCQWFKPAFPRTVAFELEEPSSITTVGRLWHLVSIWEEVPSGWGTSAPWNHTRSRGTCPFSTSSLREGGELGGTALVKSSTTCPAPFMLERDSSCKGCKYSVFALVTLLSGVYVMMEFVSLELFRWRRWFLKDCHECLWLEETAECPA